MVEHGLCHSLYVETLHVGHYTFHWLHFSLVGCYITTCFSRVRRGSLLMKSAPSFSTCCFFCKLHTLLAVAVSLIIAKMAMSSNSGGRHVCELTVGTCRVDVGAAESRRQIRTNCSPVVLRFSTIFFSDPPYTLVEVGCNGQSAASAPELETKGARTNSRAPRYGEHGSASL